jgi:predicted Fe-S protein YdhL (DUF1289 family)
MDELDRSLRSPCVRNCCLDDADVCLGCCRALGEIMEWAMADPHRRAAILANAARRRAASTSPANPAVWNRVK